MARSALREGLGCAFAELQLEVCPVSVGLAEVADEVEEVEEVEDHEKREAVGEDPKEDAEEALVSDAVE
jgi:hypothetical protein